MADERDEIERWLGRIAHAERYRDEFGNQSGRWSDNIKAMAGDFDTADELGEEAIDVNMVHSTMRTVLPPLWVTEPRVMVKPRIERDDKGADNTIKAEKTEVELNYWMRELEVRQQMKRAILDMEATNHGYIYVGWTKTKEEAEAELDPAIRHRRPFVKRLSPTKVLVPAGYTEFEEHPWIDLVFLKSLAETKERYGERAADLQATERMAIDTGTSDSHYLKDFAESEEAAIVEVHNIWDKRTKKVYILAPNHDRFLEEPKDWPWEADGFPIAHETANEIPDEYWGTPPLNYYSQQQKELNVTRTKMRKKMNRTKSVIFITDVGHDEQEAYKTADDGTLIPIGQDAKFYKDEGIGLSQSDLAYEAVIKGDILNLTGIGAEQRGAGDPNIESATASANVEKHAQVRQSDRGDRVRSLYLQIARKLWMVLRQFQTSEQRRRIIGPGNISREVTISKDDLRGEFDFDLDISAMLADNPSMRQQQAILNYNLLRADPLINPEQLLLDVFRSQNKVRPEDYLLFLRQPAEEFELMAQALPVEPHDRDDHSQHMEAHLQQMDQVDRMLQQNPQNRKIQTLQVLLVAHLNDHARRLQRLQGSTGRPPGSPVAENLLRQQTGVQQGRETQAEMGGQPLNETVQ